MSKKIIVTGSKGFIGKRLVSALELVGHEVIGIDLPEFDLPSLSPLNDHVLKVFKGVDVIYHLATMNLERCKESSFSCIYNNVIGMSSLMEIAKAYGIKRVIFSSASSVYGQPLEVLVTEEHLTDPLTIYGVTKLSSEKLIKVFGMQNKISYGIFRFTNVYGPGQVNGIIPSVIGKLLKDEIIEVTGTGNQTRDFVYVDDVIYYLIEALEKPLYNFTCNLGSGKETSINAVVGYIGSILQKEPKIMYRDPMYFDRGAFQADTTRLKEIFGYRRDFKTISDGLTETVADFRSK